MKHEKRQPPPSAVALRYDGRSAPRVTAKGKGQVAEQILEIARAHDVPISEDPQLAQLLGSIDLGCEIPTELYVAVAQVLAFAYRISGNLPPEPEGSG